MTTQPTLTPGAFAAKWRGVTTTEKAGSQSHFIDLCRMLGEPTPHEVDPTGSQHALYAVNRVRRPNFGLDDLFIHAARPRR